MAIWSTWNEAAEQDTVDWAYCSLWVPPFRGWWGFIQRLAWTDHVSMYEYSLHSSLSCQDVPTFKDRWHLYDYTESLWPSWDSWLWVCPSLGWTLITSSPCLLYSTYRDSSTRFYQKCWGVLSEGNQESGPLPMRHIVYSYILFAFPYEAN